MSAAPVDPALVLSKENAELSARAASWWVVPFGVGALLILVTIILGVIGDAPTAKLALATYHIGAVTSIGLGLGALGFVMIFHQTNAGWVASIRRQFENLMKMILPGVGLMVIGLLFILGLMAFKDVYLFKWMDGSLVAHDELLQHKRPFLNIPFFLVRQVLYFGIWIGLAVALFSFSVRQDTEGDPWLTASARKLSAPGLLLFALTVAFAAFDWMMSLDYHWFSTMFGVYYFAGNAVSSISLVLLVLILLRAFGRMHTAFTHEHLHDMSKLVFAFTVFWAYIAFSQYFLIWYANIPEETAWFMIRKDGDFNSISWLVPICHFVVPFLILLPRPNRRNPALMALACIWILVMHIIDIYFVVRPVAGDIRADAVYLDVIGVAGPILVFLGLLVRQISSVPLIPLKDPRLDEALHHENFV